MSKSTILLKVILLGDGKVGKSSLMQRYVNNTYNEDNYRTIGVEFLRKEVTVNNQKYLLQIWDTAGQEKYRSLITPFFRGSDICVLVFSFENPDSFQSVNRWKEEFYKHGDVTPEENFPFLVFGNKCDIGKNSVDYNEIIDWCSTNGQGLKHLNKHGKLSREKSTNDVKSKQSLEQKSPPTRGISKSLSDVSWIVNGIPYLPTSAKENTNVEMGFTRAIQLWQIIDSSKEVSQLIDSQKIVLTESSKLPRFCCSNNNRH